MTVHGFAGARLLPRVGRGVSVGQVWASLRVMLEARRTRRLLGDMDTRLLADIGVGPGEAQMEAARPFWDVGPSPRR